MKTTLPPIIPALSALLVVLAPISALATTIAVTSTADSGSGTLRNALASATNGDTIDARGISGTILLGNAELAVTNSVTILGPGPGTLAVDGGLYNTRRVFHIYSNSNSNLVVTISGLTITRGTAANDDGGGILSEYATTTVSNCTISANSATYGGGGIYHLGLSNSPTMTVVNCTISGNSRTINLAAYGGGGLFNDGATMTVSNCTISGNSSTHGGGGGIYNDGYAGSASLMVIASTLSGNSSAYDGGGIYNDGGSGSAVATVVNSTFSTNSTLGSGAIYNFTQSGNATLTVLNSTFSGNTGGYSVGGILHYGAGGSVQIGSTILQAGASGANLGGGVTSLGYNLSSDNGGGFLTSTGDQINKDPMLGPLQNNGGPTFTHPLSSFSQAVDAGTNFNGLAYDQRGTAFARTVDISGLANAADGTDIGAFELQASEVPPRPPAITSTNSVTFITGYSNSFRILATGIPGPAFYQTGTLPAGIGLSTNGLLSGTPPLGSGGIYPLTVIASNVAPPMATQYFTLTVVEYCNTVQNNQDSGPGSLRYALANATNRETITFCTGVTGTIKLTSGQLTVSNRVTIVGPGANVLAVDGNGSNRVFYVSSALPVSISGLTITNGYSTNTAGGIHNEQSPLTLSNCVVTGNHGFHGGGIYNRGIQGGGLLQLYNCTLSRNSAAADGGALYNAGEPVQIYNSTISSNSSSAQGGAFYNFGNNAFALFTIVNCTLSGNSSGSGSGIYNLALPGGGTASLQIGSTILNATTFSNDSFGTILSLGYNLSSDNGRGYLTNSGDQINKDPRLGPLQNNGGPTFTHALSSFSPAVDAGTNFNGLPYDQRGTAFARAVDINFIPNAGDGTDIGAFELQASEFNAPPAITSSNSVTFITGYSNSFRIIATGIPTPVIYQTGTLPAGIGLSTNGLLSGTPPLGSGGIYPLTVIASNVFPPMATQYFTLTVVEHCNTVQNNQDSGPGSLRYALANATNSQTITFCPGLTGTIKLTSGQLTVGNGVTIVGPGANVLALDGNGSSRVLYVSSSLPVSISGLTITNGYVAWPDTAGGIDNEQTTLTLSNCVVTGNHGHFGGGIYNYDKQGSRLLQIYNCTLSGNSATWGGALMNYGVGVGGNLVAQIYNSTISSNSSLANGCAVYNEDYGRTTRIINCTFSGNFSGSGVGIGNQGGTNGSLEIGGTILNATTLMNSAGTILSLGHNLSSDNGSGFLTNSGDQIYKDPRLGPLQNNGGPTFTHALSSFSPAVDAGTNFSGFATDQRGPGFARTVDLSGIPNVRDGTDIGAFELQASQFSAGLAARPSFYTNGLGWVLNGDSVNGGARITNNVFTLTDGTTGENRSGWFGFPLYVGAFEASFTYQDVGGNGADGVAFVIQNDPRGTSALGLGGGGLAYAGITSSVALLLNIYSGAPGGPSGWMLGTNGVGAYNGSGTLSGRSYQSTAPVNLDGGNPIAVALRYTGGILHVSLTDTATSANFQTDMPVNVPAFTGTNAAWVGITGSEGGILSHQIVSNFSYRPLPTLAARHSQGGSLVLTWPASVYGFELQANTNLNNTGGWGPVAATITQTNNLNQVIIPSPTGTQFYRLVLP